MTDPTFMKYRVPFGIGLFFAAIYIIYSLINQSTEYLIILGIIALIFSLMLLLTPKAIFSLERQANRVYMTDPTFMKYRILFGLFLLISGAFMIYSTIGYF
jgi:threonine/homoserine/homoserine lactone efflux protein